MHRFTNQLIAAKRAPAWLVLAALGAAAIGAASVGAERTSAAGAIRPTAPIERAHVIFGDRSAGGFILGASTPQEALTALGKPALRRAEPPYSCVFAWPAAGATFNFVDLNGGRACTSGALTVATLTSRASWRTLSGLRVGDSTARLHKLYPAALAHSLPAAERGYWLIVRHGCKEAGPAAFPGLLARVRAGRVSALVLSEAVCE